MTSAISPLKNDSEYNAIANKGVKLGGCGINLENTANKVNIITNKIFI